MDSSDSYRREINRLWRESEPGYGGNVLPVMRLYKALNDPAERQAFQTALEGLLSDGNEEVRAQAVNQCLGFFVFRDAI